MVKRLARRCDGSFRFCAGRPVVPRDDVASRRVAPGIDLAALALDPLPADEKMIVFHFSSKGQNLAQFHGGKAISLLVQVRYGE